MKKILCFLIVPAAFILMRIPFVEDASQMISLGLFIVTDFAVSLLFYFFLKRIKFNFSKSVLVVTILSAADQLIKIIVCKFDIEQKIAGDIFKIEPIKNLNQTAMFNFLNVELDGTFIIIFKAVLLLVLFCIFVKSKYKGEYLEYAFVLLLSASAATLADSAAWGYTLDYVYFSKLTCYDLKDFYVDTAIGFVILETAAYYKNKREAVKHNTADT